MNEHRGNTPRAPLSRYEATIALLLIFLGCVACLWPWLENSAGSLPYRSAPDEPLAKVGGAALESDTKLVVWAMAWVSRALGTAPSSILDANILHPASSALLGSEAFLTYFLTVGPILRLSNNAVLAANLTAFLTYPLAGWLFYLAARRLGYAAVVASLGAALFIFAPMRAPANVQVIHWSNLFLPLVSLAFLARGRLRPLWILLACSAGFGASFYMTPMAGFVATVEVVLLWRREGLKSALTSAIAVGVPTVAVGALALLYLRFAASAPQFDATSSSPALLSWFVQEAILDRDRVWLGLGTTFLLLAAGGFARPLAQGFRPSEAWWRGAACGLVGLVMAFGPALHLGESTIPLPYAWLLETPLGSLRAFPRFLVLGHFGLTLLICEFAQHFVEHPSRYGSKTRPAIAWAAATALATYLVLPRATNLLGTDMKPLEVGKRRPEVYRLLEDRPTGPLLEVPAPTSKTDFIRQSLQGDYMIQSTQHWFPIIGGHTRYVPWWYQAILDEVRLLPQPQALRAVVEMTDLRWVIVHGEHIPEERFAAWRRLPTEVNTVRAISETEGHLLLAVNRPARHGWAAALREPGIRPGFTVFGTPRLPLRPLTPARLRSEARRMQRPAGQELGFNVVTHNMSRQVWPALARDPEDLDHLVVLESQWFPGNGEVTTTTFRRDVLPGEQFTTRVKMDAPDSPGEYRIRIRIRQVGDETFSRTRPLNLRVKVITAEEYEQRKARMREALRSGALRP